MRHIDGHPFLFAEERSGAVYLYRPWFFPAYAQCCVTEQQYMVFSTLVDLVVSRRISLEAAKVAEATFIAYGWTWADDAERGRIERARQQELMAALLAAVTQSEGTRRKER